MKNQLWYNRRGIPDDEVSEYCFVILNKDSRMIYTICSKIEETLRPIIESHQRNGLVHDMNYKIYNFNSPTSLEKDQLSNIFNGKIKKDIRLYDRIKPGYENLGGLEDYVIKQILSELRKV